MRSVRHISGIATRKPRDTQQRCYSLKKAFGCRCDRVALGGCPPRAPADPDVLALEHPVPLVATSLRDTGADVQPIGWWRVTRPHWSVVLTVLRSTGTTRHHVPSAGPNGANTAIRRRCVDMGSKLKVFAMFLPDGLTTRHPLLVFPSLHRVATGMTSPGSTVL